MGLPHLPATLSESPGDTKELGDFLYQAHPILQVWKWRQGDLSRVLQREWSGCWSLLALKPEFFSLHQLPSLGSHEPWNFVE